jgi:hypothetical protein
MLKNNLSFINFIMVLIIMKLILLSILISLNQIYTCKKILLNEQRLYNKNKNLDLQLLNPNNLINPIGFLPDESSATCINGLNIYKVTLKDYNTQAYVSKRIININYTNNLTIPPQIKNIAHSIVATAAGNVFFFDNHNLLWKYNINKEQLLQLDPEPNAIDYIVTDCFIYTRHRDLNKFQDKIKIIDINYNNILAKPLIITPIANKFFIRANYLIFLYQNLEPQIYKLQYYNQLPPKKLTINFNSYIFSLDQKSNFDYNLSWDSNKNVHLATIINSSNKVTIYEFMLPSDNDILSIRTLDP